MITSTELAAFAPVWVIEAIGWASTASFLVSIVLPSRRHLHILGLFAALSTGVYAFAHGATAIWVKWVLAFFVHGYVLMFRKDRFLG